MSGDTVSQWSQACIEADAIVGSAFHGISQQQDLGQRTAIDELHKAYTGHCNQQRLRPTNVVAFGKACTEMFGPRRRLSTVALRATIQTAQDAGPLDEADAMLDQGTAALLEPRQPVEPDPATPRGKSRPWGYDVPDGDTWQGKIDNRLGIKK